MKYYILKGKKVVKATAQEWGKYFEKANRIVGRTILENGLFVSTVFLGLDHNWMGGKPLIFETMVFPTENNLLEISMKRYSTWKEAEKGHKEMVLKYSKNG